MTIIVKKKYKSRQYSLNLNTGNGSFSDEFVIFNTNDEAKAYAALKDYSDDTVEIEGISLLRNEMSVIEAGNELWFGTVSYVTSSPKAVQGLTSTYSWNTSYETEHITHALDYIGSYHSDDSIETFEGAINVKNNYGKLEVHGMDIQRSVYNFSKKIEFSPGSISDAKIKQWGDIANHINSGSFMGFESGEVRFNGAQGDEVKNKSSSVSFSFSVKKNQRNRRFGESITVPLIRGWDTYWEHYKYAEAASAEQENINAFLVKKVASVHVSSNYYYDSFSSLSFLQGSSSGYSIVPGSVS